MQRTLYIHGQHAELANAEEIAHGVQRAQEIFEKNKADPLECANALAKLKQDELITREEALLCVVWDEAEEAAFRAVTVGWLSRDVDIQLGVNP
ncbi:hypothetical protein SAMN02949497_0274 [Methylomagnum ishizawai]|uniref:Uncharacterized protein n=1 Tax=Methylomagnum ishizawai TaxID=1760988 RepID=A0A1Y6DC98_9GAMM|nr:hypothetical protein [Methylomagnum ishizawai]SMF97704.1 hypothetical protein SAMN02949497_0274 [Methylomagnum ishizawai]